MASMWYLAAFPGTAAPRAAGRIDPDQVDKTRCRRPGARRTAGRRRAGWPQPARAQAVAAPAHGDQLRRRRRCRALDPGPVEFPVLQAQLQEAGQIIYRGPAVRRYGLVPVPARRARTSPTVRSWLLGSGSGKCVWIW
jgi:hypothetical protein